MKLSKVFETLGNNIGKWRKLLIDMKNSQTSFDSSEVEKSFAPIVIHYGNVRNKVDSKYFDFRKSTFNALRTKLGDLLRNFHNSATRGKRELEEMSFDVSSTKGIVTAVTSLQKLRDESSTWRELLQESESAEKLLVSNRYNLGPTWMYTSRVKAVLDDFFSVFTMRWNSLETEAQYLE